MSDLPDLTIPATAELLEGWCGPVLVLYGDGPWPEMWAGGLRVYDGSFLNVHSLDGCAYLQEANPGRALQPHSLDLARAEVRDRVARVHRQGESHVARSLARGLPVLHALYRLHGLDPHDDTRLPDGSRLVDALALRAEWMQRMEVQGG